MHLIGVNLMGMHLIDMYLMGMHLKGVAKSVSDPWGAKNSASRGTSNGPAGWTP